MLASVIDDWLGHMTGLSKTATRPSRSASTSARSSNLHAPALMAASCSPRR
ncbi:hypothetical protein [Comamonas sp. JC664]|uniref:hypothetical protein n=1 Tax=Comamonas sp. JC664 TaxID=2801917 RepID=UPI003613020A